MMNPTKTCISIFAAALLAGLSVQAVPRTAQAEPTYPPLLQEALEKKLNITVCIPQCSACHLTNAGGPGNYNPLGLKLLGGLGANASQETMNKAVSDYLDTNPDTDGDGVSDADEIKLGDSPTIAGERGKNQFCPDIKYGCAGGRIAAAPARDDKPAAFAAGLVAAALGVAMGRRRRRARAAR